MDGSQITEGSTSRRAGLGAFRLVAAVVTSGAVAVVALLGLARLWTDVGAVEVVLPLSDEGTGEPFVPSVVATTPSASATAAPTITTLVVPPGGSLVASSLRRGEHDVVPVWADPDDAEPAWELSATTEFGSYRHFLVLEEKDSWLKIAVPVRPNGSVGWILREDVALSVSEYRVRIRLSDRTFQVWRDGEVIIDTISAIGNDRAPTPLGEFYIRDIFAWDPQSVYGPWVLALSAYSEHIDQINGGDAVVAIHGTNRPDLIGQAVSLGCIRLENDDVTLLAETVPVGTPVEIIA